MSKIKYVANNNENETFFFLTMLFKFQLKTVQEGCGVHVKFVRFCL